MELITSWIMIMLKKIHLPIIVAICLGLWGVNKNNYSDDKQIGDNLPHVFFKS